MRMAYRSIDDLCRVIVGMLTDQRTEYPSWTHFQQHLLSIAKQFMESIKKAYRLAQVTSPIRRICCLRRCNPGASHIRDIAYLWSVQLHLAYFFYETSNNSIHHKRVCSMRDLQQPVLDP